MPNLKDARDESENPPPPKERVPIVFLSYSHDSKEHKQWVAELASRLRKSGIDVVLDQWDLSPGDDFAKFMERAISSTDRVLAICTEPYVRKADEGTGGVGYESMIVTGEIVRDLGTQKFIPIFRQTDGGTQAPRALNTRFGVNLADSANVDAEFDRLLRELHRVPAPRPPLGPNPYAESVRAASAEAEAPATTTASNPPSTRSNTSRLESGSPLETYRSALEICRQGDAVRWRREVRDARRETKHTLLEWRAEWDSKADALIRDHTEAADQLIEAVSPLLAMALAGVESCDPRFNKQNGLLDDILHPQGWERSGLTLLVEAPFTAGWAYQTLHGALCMSTQQFALAADLARERYEIRESGNTHSLFKISPAIGWPPLISDKYTEAWRYSLRLADKYPWLNEPFGDQNSYQISVSAYYLLLNLIELVDFLSEGNGEQLRTTKLGGLRFHVPLVFSGTEASTMRSANRFLLANRDQVREIWRSQGVSDQTMEQFWPDWVNHCVYATQKVYPYGDYAYPTGDFITQILRS